MNKLLIASLLLAALSACTDKNAATQANFSKAMNDYLAQRGDLCLARYDWPIAVTPQQFAIGDRDALQMPVLEKLGLVQSSEQVVRGATMPSSEAIKVREYQLTEAGRKYYLQRDIASHSASGAVVIHHADFCAAHLSLDKVVGWELSDNADKTRQAVVTYTYHVDAAPWTQDADAQKVFPAVARVIHGAGSAQLREVFTLTSDGWVASDLLG